MVMFMSVQVIGVVI